MKKIISIILSLTMVLSTLIIVPMVAKAETELNTTIADEQWQTLPYGESFQAFLNTTAVSTNYGTNKTDEGLSGYFINNNVIFNGAKLFNSTTPSYGISITNSNATTPYTIALTSADIKYYKEVGTIWRKGNVDATLATHTGTLRVTYTDNTVVDTPGHGYTTQGGYIPDILGEGTNDYADGAHYITRSSATGHDSEYYPIKTIGFMSHNSAVHAAIGVEYSLSELKETVLPAIIDDLATKKASSTDISTEVNALINTVNSANARVSGTDVIASLSEDLQTKYADLITLPEEPDTSVEIVGDAYAKGLDLTDTLNALSAHYEHIFTFTAMNIEDSQSIRTETGGGTGTLNANSYWTHFIDGDELNEFIEDNPTVKLEVPRYEVDETRTIAETPSSIESIVFDTSSLFTGIKSGERDMFPLLYTTQTVPLSGKFIKSIAVIGITNAGLTTAHDIGYIFTRSDGTQYQKDDSGKMFRLWLQHLNETRLATLTAVHNVQYNTSDNTIDPVSTTRNIQISLSHILPEGETFDSVTFSGSGDYGNRASIYSVIEVEYPFEQVGAVLHDAIEKNQTAQTEALTKAIITTYASALANGYDYTEYDGLTDDDVTYISSILEEYPALENLTYDIVTGDTITPKLTFAGNVNASNIEIKVGGETVTPTIYGATATFDVPKKFVGMSDVRITVNNFPYGETVYTLVVPVKVSDARYYSDENLETETDFANASYVSYDVETNLTAQQSFYVHGASYGKWKMNTDILLSGTAKTGTFGIGQETTTFSFSIDKTDCDTHKFILWDSITNLKRLTHIYSETF